MAGGMSANDPLAETFQREIIHTWHRIGVRHASLRLAVQPQVGGAAAAIGLSRGEYY